MRGTDQGCSICFMCLIRLSGLQTGLQPPVSIGGRFASPGIVITPAVSAAGVVWIPTGEAASVEECAGSPFPVAAFEADGKVVSLPEEGREQFCLSRYSRVCDVAPLSLLCIAG